MAYRNNPKHSETERDEAYVSETASKRQKLMTRNFCDKDILGHDDNEDENRVDRFKRQLREGQQQLNQD